MEKARAFARNWEDKSVWVTKDGRTLKPEEMEDSHLLSAIRFLKKKASGLKESADLAMSLTRGPDGDMAQLAFAYEQEAQFNLTPIEWLKQTTIYRLLQEEVTRRGLAD